MFAANPFLLAFWSWMTPVINVCGYSTDSQRDLLRSAQVAELVTRDAATKGIHQVESLLI
jgi:hypothetical protein